MAMLFMDSCDHYTSAEILKKWLSGGLTMGTPGRRGVGGLAILNNYCCVDLTGHNGTVVMGAAVYFNYTLSNTFVMTVAGATNLMQAGIRTNALGGFDVCRAAPANAGVTMPEWLAQYGTKLGATRNGVVQLGVWYYIEAKIVIHDSAGSVIIHVNGVNEPTTANDCSSGQDTLASGTVENAVLGHMGSSWNSSIDDVYMLDTSGSVNNDFLGDVRVDAHYPVTPDGTNHDWTPSTGSDNYAVVDDPTANTTDYNSTNTLNATDTFNLNHLKSVGGTIKAVQALIYHARADAGPSSALAPVMISDVTTDVGATVASSAGSYIYTRKVYDQDPHGPAAWDETAFNALEVGYRKIG